MICGTEECKDYGYRMPANVFRNERYPQANTINLDVEGSSQHSFPDQNSRGVGGYVVMSTVSRGPISLWNATNVTGNAYHICLVTPAAFIASLCRIAVDFDEFRNNSVSGGQTVKTFEGTS